MGVIQHQETHVRRSSSMSLDLRWKHEYLRIIAVAALFAIGAILLFSLLLYGTAAKRVTVIIDGRESVVVTKQWVVQRLLDERNIQVGEHDRVSIPLDGKLKSGERIVINHAKPVQMTADGETKQLYTIARTVGDALTEWNVDVGEHDKLNYLPEDELVPNADLKIVRVKKETEQYTENVPFETVTKNDPQLLKGKEQTVQEGQEGVVLKTKEKVYEDGVLVTEQVVDEKVQSESVSKVVAVGTKNPVVVLSASSPNMDEVTKNGITFGYKQVVKNITLTAYTANFASTGKGASHPGFGVTSTGTQVMEGRTIAVDPKVVPLGWWVYIEGIGFRRAEDTGSAVKGNLIDIYFDSADYANRFGMKRGYTVYIIGPKKPSAD